MDASPHLLTGKLAKKKAESSVVKFSCLEAKDVLGLPNTANQLVPAVAHDGAHAEEEDSRSEALGGQVSLSREVSLSILFSAASLKTHDIWRKVYVSIVVVSNPAGACFPRHNPLATPSKAPMLQS